LNTKDKSFQNDTSIMLIDSCEIDNFINQTLLRQNGITEITTYNNINSALLHLKTTNKQYHLILLDIYFPVMDGFEFIKELQAIDSKKKFKKICLLSASIDPSHKARAKEKNIKLIEKPLAINKILLLIEKF